jgi:hypothetical protein
MPSQSYRYALDPADLSDVACVLRLTSREASEVGAVVYRGPRLGASTGLAYHLSGVRAV